MNHRQNFTYFNFRDKSNTHYHNTHPNDKDPFDQ